MKNASQKLGLGSSIASMSNSVFMTETYFREMST